MKLGLLIAIFLVFRKSEGFFERNLLDELLTYYDDCYKPKPFSHFTLVYDTLGPAENYDPTKAEGPPKEDIEVLNEIKKLYGAKVESIFSNTEVELWLDCASGTREKIKKDVEKRYAFAQMQAMRCVKFAWLNFLERREDTSANAVEGCYATCMSKDIIPEKAKRW
ncbi:unnamed protein product [Callosobruchus maculatus]|uniref:Uncharacterized protein n=1 Tax=Callosobruchus maculatus TaxID=64391 RepID=A0A653D607_CALMS|nr:unnamed protein product [Callosobruchus maculatus]